MIILSCHLGILGEKKKKEGPLRSPWCLLPLQAWVCMDCTTWCITAGSGVDAARMIRREKDLFYRLKFCSFRVQITQPQARVLPSSCARLPPSLSKQKKQYSGHFFVVLWVALVGQRSSCSDLVFSNKCALCRSTLLRHNTAQAGEFSMATNKTQVRLCQATSDYLNKCQRRNQTWELSASDPQDKEPIDFPH